MKNYLFKPTKLQTNKEHFGGEFINLAFWLVVFGIAIYMGSK